MGKIYSKKEKRCLYMRGIWKVFFAFLLVSAGMLNVLGQDRTVSGYVKDSETGDALIGVSVTVKGNTIGKITDIEGRFTLTHIACYELLISCKSIF